MKNREATGLIVLLIFFFVVGMGYSKNDYSLADTEPESTYSEPNSNVTENNSASTVIVPVATSSAIKPGIRHKTTPETTPGIDSSFRTDFYIDVSVKEQKLRIFNREQQMKEWTVSTGKNNTTPLGRFTIQNRGEWFFSERYQEGAMWWVSFKDWGTYLFHSVPMDNNRSVIPEEADKLGYPASHGCVRLEEEHAKWIYDNIPYGTEVYIHD